MKTTKQVFFAIITGVVLASVYAVPALALGEGGTVGGVDAARGVGVPSNLGNGDSSIVHNIVNILLYIIGVLSVIMLIFGGFRYVVSGGQKDKVTNAKNTILYAIVGLLVAIFAYAIVQFVVRAAMGAGSTTNV